MLRGGQEQLRSFVAEDSPHDDRWGWSSGRTKSGFVPTGWLQKQTVRLGADEEIDPRTPFAKKAQMWHPVEGD